MKIDYISDLHMDFYVKNSLNGKKEYDRIDYFIEIYINPNKDSDTIIIAGDISHYNKQIEVLCKVLLDKYYKNVIITYGNHELYLISGIERNKYGNSLNKIKDLKDRIEKIEGAFFLDGNIVEIDSIKIGGTPMWYDFSRILKRGMNIEYAYSIWYQFMNDAVYIDTKDHLNINIIEKMPSIKYNKIIKFDPIKFFNNEKAKLDKIVNQCDIIVTHISPFYPKSRKYDNSSDVTAFYCFDGEHYIYEYNNIKYWIFGHVHEDHEIDGGNIIFLCNPLGYPSECNFNYIKTIEI